jgi:hypothetical protein
MDRPYVGIRKKSFGPNQDGLKSPSRRDGLFMPFLKSWTFGTSISY